MTDRKITLQLTSIQVGYITGALKMAQDNAVGRQVGLIQRELKELRMDIIEQVTDYTLQTYGLFARLTPEQQKAALAYRGPDMHPYTAEDAALDDAQRRAEYARTTQSNKWPGGDDG